jgi:hypothetical protein
MSNERKKRVLDESPLPKIKITKQSRGKPLPDHDQIFYGKPTIDADGFLKWLLTLNPIDHLTNASLIRLIQKNKMYFLVRQFKDLYDQFEATK